MKITSKDREKLAYISGEHLFRSVCLMVEEFPQKTENVMKVFLAIALSDDSDLGFGVLVGKLGITNATVSRCAKQLQDNKYAVIYNRHGDHHRALNCKLTAKGKTFFEKLTSE